jgi:hypothetical protein
MPLLALLPLRRRTVAALLIGEQLVKSSTGWSLDIPAQDIKTGQPLECPLSPEMSRRIRGMSIPVRMLGPGVRAADVVEAEARVYAPFDGSPVDHTALRVAQGRIDAERLAATA